MIIKRARGHRLYTGDGKKILDLSMDFGRGVIGHRPNGLSLTFKNIIDRGLYARYDNIYKNRLIKELNKIFPEHLNVTFMEYEDKIKKVVDTPISDPLFNNDKSSVISYWRPFLPIPDARHIIVLYPLPGLNSVTIVVSKEILGVSDDTISPVLLSGILRSIYDYDLELKKFSVDNYTVYNSISNTELNAPYLIFKHDADEYKNMCLDSKESGILLNDVKQFAVLAPDYSYGEQNKIIKFLERR